MHTMHTFHYPSSNPLCSKGFSWGRRYASDDAYRTHTDAYRGLFLRYRQKNGPFRPPMSRKSGRPAHLHAPVFRPVPAEAAETGRPFLRPPGPPPPRERTVPAGRSGPSERVCIARAGYACGMHQVMHTFPASLFRMVPPIPGDGLRRYAWYACPIRENPIKRSNSENRCIQCIPSIYHLYIPCIPRVFGTSKVCIR